MYGDDWYHILSPNLCHQEYLDDSDGVDLAKFQDKIWTNIKDIYKPPAEAQETKEALPDEDVATGSQVGNRSLALPNAASLFHFSGEMHGTSLCSVHSLRTRVHTLWAFGDLYLLLGETVLAL